VGLWLLVFLSFLVLILFLFGVFLTCFGVSVGFSLGSCWSSFLRSVNCVFLRTSGRFRVLLGWIYGFWEISFSFGGNPFLFGALFTCSGVSVGF